MKNLLKRISLSLLLGANLCTILLLWLSVALTYVSPDVCPRLSLLTLAFPIFLAANLLFIILWLLVHARLTWIPVAATLLVANFALDYCPIHLTGTTQPTTHDTTITIVTYNVGRMANEEQRSQFIQFIDSSQADIICLQELYTTFISSHQEWFERTHYSVLQANNIAILSRLPFLSDTISITYPTRSNHSLACWIDCMGDSLLLINNHLESNHLSPEEKDEYTNTITDPNRESIKHSSHMLVGKLSEATAYRGAQTDSICALIDRNTSHPVIVCGDLNETPISYTYQRLAKRLRSAYREAASGPGFTYTQRSFPVRIDHLFYPKDWTCTDCRIDRSTTSSDHYPLIVRLSKKTH